MKRALVVGTGTVMGVAAVLALNPDGTVASPAAAGASSTSASSGTMAGANDHSPQSPSSGTSSGSSAPRTFAGSTVDVGHGYGSIAVEVAVTAGRIVDITALEVPQNDHRSAMISQMAFPRLKQQAIRAHSAEISGVSGASYTSAGFAESLRSALTLAGMAR
jgi:uncharacterized protein with FMN-binding domain